MTKHTPGPWPLTWFAGKRKKGDYVFDISDKLPWTKANARLFHAAPDLLEACKTVSSAQTYNQLLEAKDIVQQAIRKAEESE